MPQEPTRDAPDSPIDDAVIAAARRYFDARRAMVDGFVRENFGLRGTLRLHRAALGLDILRAPLNVMLSPVYVATRLAGLLAGAVGLKKAATWLMSRQILIETDVARAVETLVAVRLLELPWPGGNRASGRDALAEAVLSAPQVRDLVRRRPDAAEAQKLGHNVARSLGEYSGTRSAVGEMTTAIGTIGAGAVAFQALTPGVVSIAPSLAAVLAHSVAIGSFPLGGAIGSVWYGLFPADAPLWLWVAVVAGLLMAAAVVSAFAGLVADPVQTWLGIHQRRLNRLIDTLETEFAGPGGKAFMAREHYLARLMDLADAGVATARIIRG